MLPIPAPGVIPVLDICMVRASLSNDLEASASITMMASGEMFSEAYFISSALSIPVYPRTFGDKADTVHILMRSNSSGALSFK